MFLADTIDGLQSTAVGKDEKTKTVMMMQAEVKFQDSKSPSEEELVKNLGNPANEKPTCKEVVKSKSVAELMFPQKRKLCNFCKIFMTKRAQVIIFRVENLIEMDLEAENV